VADSEKSPQACCLLCVQVVAAALFQKDGQALATRFEKKVASA